MKSTPIRKPEEDIMLAPGNAALILIDYQPPQVSTVESMDRLMLINNVLALAKTAKLHDVPIILSTVNVSNGVNEDMLPFSRADCHSARAIRWPRQARSRYQQARRFHCVRPGLLSHTGNQSRSPAFHRKA